MRVRLLRKSGLGGSAKTCTSICHAVSVFLILISSGVRRLSVRKVYILTFFPLLAGGLLTYILAFSWPTATALHCTLHYTLHIALLPSVDELAQRYGIKRIFLATDDEKIVAQTKVAICRPMYSYRWSKCARVYCVE
jgi:hypothetical protein